jgi:glycosyltransferase involved in cell wall biosynthesis
MHVAFVHQTYPAQFGHLAKALVDRHGWTCTFVSRNASGREGPIELIQYHNKGGATERTHFCSRTFENGVWHAHAVYEALKARPDIRPDLVVGHSGFGTTVFLRQLYDRPVVGFFEYYYHPRNSDIDFRPDMPPLEIERLRAQTRNAMILLDLELCTAGYSPTRWQRDLLPATYRNKVNVVFDGIDTAVWQPTPARDDRQVAGYSVPAGAKVLTYAARGFEAMRGFDVFLAVARKVCAARSDVVVLVAGEDQVYYGGDKRFTGGMSFGEWALARSGVDRSRFVFFGRLEASELARLFAVGDCHVYLTVPFVLSWSLLNALACGAAVVASGTAPVREVIRDGETGLLADFFDVDGLAAAVLKILADPAAYAPLRSAGVALVRERYSLDVCLPRLKALFEAVAQSL